MARFKWTHRPQYGAEVGNPGTRFLSKQHDIRHGKAVPVPGSYRGKVDFADDEIAAMERANADRREPGRPTGVLDAAFWRKQRALASPVYIAGQVRLRPPGYIPTLLLMAPVRHGAKR